ncbi:MAG: TusE/DsrC/DsvC family sulfur relay protein [Thiotrichales bacterium]
MSSIQIQSREIPLNHLGFLASFHDWNEDVTREMADADGLALTECHWVAIRFLREYFAQYDVPPSPRTMLKAVGEKLHHSGRCTYRHLNEMFPRGGCKQACRLAGLPDFYCHSC